MKKELLLAAAMMAAMSLAGCQNSDVTPAETDVVEEEDATTPETVAEDNETVFDTDGADAAEAEEVEGTAQE